MATVLHIPFPLVLLYWYGITCALQMFDYALWVRFQDNNKALSQDLQSAYLAFCVIGLVAYVFIGGPMFFLGYKYSPTQKARDKKIRIGLMIMYFTSTLPMFLLELTIVWNQNITYVLQGICFVLQLFAWVFGSFAVWFVYMWQVAKLWHVYRGGGRQLVFQQKDHRGMGGAGDGGHSPTLRPPLPFGSARKYNGQPDII